MNISTSLFMTDTSFSYGRPLLSYEGTDEKSHVEAHVHFGRFGVVEITIIAASPARLEVDWEAIEDFVGEIEGRLTSYFGVLKRIGWVQPEIHLRVYYNRHRTSAMGVGSNLGQMLGAIRQGLEEQLERSAV